MDQLTVEFPPYIGTKLKSLKDNNNWKLQSEWYPDSHHIRKLSHSFAINQKLLSETQDNNIKTRAGMISTIHAITHAEQNSL